MKKRRIILSICLALMLSLTSLALFGCGKKTSISNTYKLFEETMTVLKDSSLFGENSTIQNNDTEIEKTVINFDTEFKLNSFGEVASSSGSYTINEQHYNQYTILLAEGLNFIDEYYPLLKDVTIKKNYKDMDESIKSVKSNFSKTEEAYKDLPKTSDGLKLNGVDVPEAVYNYGYFYTYKKAAANFVDSVYDCAKQLRNFLNDEVKYTANVGNEKMTAEQLQFYFDNEVLSLYDDYRLLFLNSFEGEYLTGNSFDNCKDTLCNLSKITGKKVKGDVTAEQAKELKTFFGKLDETRADVRKAVNNFSYYRFEKVFESNFDPYLKENENAEIYYNLLEAYFRVANQTSIVYRVTAHLETYLETTAA